jgi:hypothetical protein
MVGTWEPEKYILGIQPGGTFTLSTVKVPLLRRYQNGAMATRSGAIRSHIRTKTRKRKWWCPEDKITLLLEIIFLIVRKVIWSHKMSTQDEAKEVATIIL